MENEEKIIEIAAKCYAYKNNPNKKESVSDLCEAVERATENTFAELNVTFDEHEFLAANPVNGDIDNDYMNEAIKMCEEYAQEVEAIVGKKPGDINTEDLNNAIDLGMLTPGKVGNYVFVSNMLHEIAQVLCAKQNDSLNL